jgi:hypothetical protein
MAKMVSDIELLKVHDLIEALEGLNAAQARRVLTYVWDRFFTLQEDLQPHPPLGCRAVSFTPPLEKTP